MGSVRRKTDPSPGRGAVSPNPFCETFRTSSRAIVGDIAPANAVELEERLPGIARAARIGDPLHDLAVAVAHIEVRPRVPVADVHLRQVAVRIVKEAGAVDLRLGDVRLIADLGLLSFVVPDVGRRRVKLLLPPPHFLATTNPASLGRPTQRHPYACSSNRIADYRRVWSPSCRGKSVPKFTSK